MSAVSWCKVGVLSSVLASVFAWGAASSVAFEPTPNELSELSTVITKAAPSSMIEDVMSKTLSKATFAGGCFWCMEAPFDELDGVESTTSGYAGGTLENPTYTQVSAGSTGHAEVVQVVYDPEKVSYETLLKVFWQ
ncbi:MAG: peptide-methionine (S)-S-oxide reductase, partial [Gammaproteobacteria bacterium]